MELRDTIIEKLSQKMDNANVRALFKDIAVQQDGNTIYFRANDSVFLERIKVLFGHDLSFVLREKIDEGCVVKYVVSNEHSTISPLITQESPIIEADHNLDTHFQLDNFVIGRSNEMAYSAAMAVAQSFGKSMYNPFFIYGDSGLGKTHLMQAIGNKICAGNKKVKCMYVTADMFRNELIDAIKNRTTEKFRDQYRMVDVLLIDDIHVIEKSESVQEEFFHTFNDLYKLKKQIVITSDRPPAEINLEKRLITRFEWGLVTDIKKPELETRIAILKKKAEAMGMTVPSEHLFFIADNVTSNVRKLEGCLKRLEFYQRLSGKISNLSKNDIQSLLVDFFDNSLRDVTVEAIKKSVAQYFHITIKMLEGKRRNKEIVMPRFIAMYLARKYTKDTLQSIGEAFGGRDHAGVINACSKIEERLSEDMAFKNEMDKIIAFLNNGGS